MSLNQTNNLLMKPLTYLDIRERAYNEAVGKRYFNTAFLGVARKDDVYGICRRIYADRSCNISGSLAVNWGYYKFWLMSSIN